MELRTEISVETERNIGVEKRKKLRTAQPCYAGVFFKKKLHQHNSPGQDVHDEKTMWGVG